MPGTLTRTSSGLLVYDDFSSDTTGNYSHYKSTLAVGSGLIYKTDDDTVQTFCVQTGSVGALCVTARVFRDDYDYGAGVFLGDNGSISAASDVDGYVAWHFSGTDIYIQKMTDESPTNLTNTAVTHSDNSWAYNRLYRDGNDIVVRYGMTSLGTTTSANDTTYTTTLYGGIWLYMKDSDHNAIDWLDIRTSHEITCTHLPSGYYLKVSDGTTTAKAQESSGTATVDAGAVLFPLASVAVYDGDPDGSGNLVDSLDTGDHTDMGGGDAYDFDQELEPTGVASTLAIGSATVVDQHIWPTGIASTLAIGSLEIYELAVYPTGIASTLAIGTPALTQTLEPSGIASTLAIGTPALVQTLEPTGIASTLGIGTAWLYFPIYPDGVASTLDYGTPQVIEIPSTNLDIPESVTSPMELRSAAGTYQGLLPYAFEVSVRQAINSLDVLTFSHPVDNEMWDNIAIGSLVRLQGVDYRVNNINDSRSGTVLTAQVQAEQYCVNLGDTLEKSIEIEDEYASTAMSTILSGTGWTLGGCSSVVKVSFEATWPSPLSALLKVADLANGELVFDSVNLVVYLLTQRGRDAGASVVYRKNIQGLTRTRSGEIFNRVWFEGKDGLSTWHGYIQDATSINTYGRRDIFWGDTSITNLSTLLYGAQLRLAAYKTQRFTYTATAYNVRTGDLDWIVAELGDTVNVYDEDLGINTNCRVYERTYYPFNPERPDSLTLSSGRRWFPNLSEKMAEKVNDPSSDANAKLQQKKSRKFPVGPGAYNWVNLVGAEPSWKGDGKPHFFTNQMLGIDEGEGDPELIGGVWYTGEDISGDGHPEDGPYGTDDGDEDIHNATGWEPAGVDLDGDGVADYWPFSGVEGAHSIGGGHCWSAGSSTPTEWDWNNEGPYLASDFVPQSQWADLSGYDYYGYDANGDGEIDEVLDIANLPLPVFRTENDGLQFGIDMGGGDIDWYDPPTNNPLWHGWGGALAAKTYLTGWSEDGTRNASGPIGVLNGTWSWDPEPFDTDDDGYPDFWPYAPEAHQHGRTWILSTIDGREYPTPDLQIPQSSLDELFPATSTAGALRIGTVTAVNEDDTIDILTEDGDTLESVPYLDGYSPEVDDTVVYGRVL